MLFSKTYPSFLTLKEGSTFLTKPLFPQGREDVTALRRSEPLRYKVGGPSKVFARLCGMGPPRDNYSICISLMLIYTSQRKTKTSNKYIVISSLTLLQIQRNPQHFWNHQIVGNTYLHKVRETYCVYLPLSYLPKLPLCRPSAILCIVPRSW